MQERAEQARTVIRNNQGQEVPIVSFYSVQGGVGKSTLARKFAELITVAPGNNGVKPNVLLIDLDVEAQGLTYRLTDGVYTSRRTAHEIIAEQNVVGAQATDVSRAVQLASGNPDRRGQLFLLPAAPPEAKGIFDTLAGIPKETLITLLRDLIQELVRQLSISCVIIDCAPGANPYTAAAAALADVPLLIGRNEQTTYDQIRVLPERFREWYPNFQPAKQRVIINAVTVKELFEQRKQSYAILDYIPLTSDVIHETEGLPRTGSLRMMLFEKFIVDIMEMVFVGKPHLIPNAPEVVGQEWIERLAKLERCEKSPKVRRLRPLRHLRWIGIILVVIGIALIALNQILDDAPSSLVSGGIGAAVVGSLMVLVGWYAESERNRLVTTAKDLVYKGPEEILKMLNGTPTQRKTLEEMKKMAETIPAEQRQQQQQPAKPNRYGD